ncbi:MAG: type IV secretion system protein [Alphaproteobacteria bacterium]|nr:type IV secretion system protein [Alphaproteobacteria bacterium]
MDQLITNVDNIIFAFVQGSFGNLSGIVETLWRLMFIVFIAVYGYKVIISGRFSTSDIITHCLKIIVVLALATQWDTFFQFVYRMTTETPSDLAGQMMLAASDSLGGTGADTTVTANTALSQFYERAMAVCERLLEGASFSHWELFLYAVLVWFGALGFVGYALMLIILAKLAVALLLAIGPIFILLLIFNNTRNLFEGWLRTLLNYAIVPIFVYTLLSLLLALAEAPLRYLEQHSGLYDKFMTSIGPFVLISFISILLLAQIMNIAASITSGLSLSTLGSGLWTSRITASGAKTGTFVTAAWGWKKAEPVRQYAAKKTAAARKALKQVLTRTPETV